MRSEGGLTDMNGNAGSDIHQYLISAAEVYLRSKGYTIKDRSLYQALIGLKVPSIPDLMATKRESYRDTRGRRRDVIDAIIVEVEMKPTKASIRKKEKQYSENLVGWTLIILDARGIRGMRQGWDNVTMRAIQDWLQAGL